MVNFPIILGLRAILTRKFNTHALSVSIPKFNLNKNSILVKTRKRKKNNIFTKNSRKTHGFGRRAKIFAPIFFVQPHFSGDLKIFCKFFEFFFKNKKCSIFSKNCLSTFKPIWYTPALTFTHFPSWLKKNLDSFRFKKRSTWSS